MKTFNLKTNTEEIINYDNIVVESVEETTIPEKIDIKKTSYTVGSVKEQLAQINEKIAALTIERDNVLELQDLIEIEADKVVNAIR
jgi:hypothetical protein